MRNRSKKTVSILFVTVLTIAVVYLGLSKNVDQAYSMRVDNFESSFKKLEKEQKNTSKKIVKLYADENQTYITQSLNEEEIDQIREDVEKFDKNFSDLNKELYDLSSRDQAKYVKKLETKEMNESLQNYYISLGDLKTKKELTDLVNNLFLQEYMKGDTVNTDVLIPEDLDVVKIEILNKKVNQKSKEKTLTNSEEYLERLEKGIIIAKEQLTDFNRASELREELFDKNGFLVLTDMEKIEEFQLIVEKIKNPDIKTAFDEYIRIVRKYEVEHEEDNLITNEEGQVDSDNLEEQDNNDYERPSSIIRPNNNSNLQSGQTNNQRPNSQGNTGLVTKPKPVPKPEAEPKPEPRPEPKPEPQPEPQPEPKPEPQPEPKPDPTPEPEPPSPNESDD